MTAALDVLEAIQRSGGHVSLVAPDRIRVSAPPALLPNLVARVRKAKPDLLSVLAKRDGAARCGEPWDAKDWKAYFDERAAIREYDGGFSRPEAEELAWQDVWNAMHKGYGGTWPSSLTDMGISSPISGRNFTRAGVT